MLLTLVKESHDELAILFSTSAIFSGESAILSEKAGMMSEHSTDPISPPVTSSDRGYIRRTPSGVSSVRELLLQHPDLPDFQCSRQQQPSGTSQLSPVEKEAIRWKGKPWRPKDLSLSS